MGVQMRDGLSGLFAGIDDEPVAFGGKAGFLYDSAYRVKKFLHNAHFTCGHVLHSREMLLGDRKQVRWRLGVDVPENNRFFIFKNPDARYLARDDFAEDAVRHTIFLLSRMAESICVIT
jgi:hypothetical protein